MKCIFAILLWIGVSGAAAQEAEARVSDQLRVWVERLAQGPRVPADPDSLHRAAAWIAQTWEDMGLPVTRQPVATEQGVFHNVLTHVGPAEGARIVVGAHYDTVAGSPGADDNASGVALVIMLAKRLGSLKESLARRVDLAAFVLEENPYTRTDQMGSIVYAKSLAEAGVPVHGMISLEMVGFFRDRPYSQSFPSAQMFDLYGTKANFLVVMGRLGLENEMAERLADSLKQAMEIPVFPFLLPAGTPDLYRSDHLAFWKYQMPAVMISDTGSYRNPHYHGAKDKPETLDYERMAKLAVALTDFLQAAPPEP